MRTTRPVFRSILAAILVLARVAAAATPADTCAAAKLTAASKKAVAKLACWGKAVKMSVPVDDACLAKADQRFTAAFVAAEAKGRCRTTGDAAAVEAHVDAIVMGLVVDEPGDCVAAGDSCGSTPCCVGLVCAPSTGGSTCQTPTTTSTTTTTTLPPCGSVPDPQCGGACSPGHHCALDTSFPPPNCFCRPDVHPPPGQPVS